MPRPIRIKYTIPAGAQFGAPRGNGTRIHQGCDYHCPIGTPIYGTGDGGTVTHIGYNGDPLTGSGNNVVIQYGNRVTTDMHLRERTPLHVGSVVNHDTIVGYVGITGNAVNADPPGSHDHHEVRINGKLINPESFYGLEPASLDLERIIEKEEDTMLRFITRDGTGVWYATDGLTKRALGPGENQLLVDLGLAVYEAGNKPKLLGANLDLIPDAVRVVGPDPVAIAAALAPLLPQPVAEATLLTAIIPAIAKAVNDDAAKRLAS